MQHIISIVLPALLLAAPMSSYALYGKDDPDEERKEFQKASSTALDRLYYEKLSPRNEVKPAKGYAVFSIIGINLFVVATERGGGILRDSHNGKNTCMKMFSADGGAESGDKGMGTKAGLALQGTKFWADDDLN